MLKNFFNINKNKNIKPLNLTSFLIGKEKLFSSKIISSSTGNDKNIFLTKNSNSFSANKLFKNFQSYKFFSENTNFKPTSIDILKDELKTDIQKSLHRGKNRLPYNLKEGDLINSFRVQKIIKFEEFQMTGFILEHEATGAKYFHIDSSDLNNTFAIHFCTPAFNNTGVFHILEHLSLCGSKKYPVRDPFMNMMKRSLNSYMNAWTGSDFTMYLFAAQNEKDFQNLRDVYLDAVYNPNLDYLDFLQEGWRFEFLEPENKKSGLQYKGVVLNEMKGDMSRQDSYFIHKLQSCLLNDLTYKYNSGGDPKNIPELKYEDLVNTHKKYYHPSNTKFFSYGDLNFLENLEFLEKNLLYKYSRDSVENLSKGEKFSVERSNTWTSPKEVMDFYQPELGGSNTEEGNNEQNAQNLSKMAFAYLCNDINENPYETFKLSILAHLLMEGPSSTMYKGLIESGLAPGYCHGYGMDTSLRESIITIGVQNIENDYKKFKQIEDAIFDGLLDVANKGFESKLIEEVLHLIEYDSIKPKDDFGVNFLNQSSGFFTHSNYPFPMLQVNEFSAKLKRELKSDPNVFQNLVKKYLIENNHRLKLILRPKDDLLAKLNKEESESLTKIDQSLTNEEAEKIIQDTNNLIKHQSQIQDMNILPCLNLEDIPTLVETITHTKHKLVKDIPLTFFDQPTNGISFLRIKANIKEIPDDLKAYISLYNLILPRLGTKNYTYEEFQNKLHTNSAGLSVSVDAFSDINNITHEYENLVYEFSFLDSNMNKAMSLYSELFSTPNFFDLQNLNNIIKQESVKIANEITNNSLDYAISHANSGLKSYKKTYDAFMSDMFICKLGSDLLQLASPRDVLQTTAEKLYLLHNLIFRKDAIEFSLHGSVRVLESISAQINLMINEVKNNNEVFERDIKREDSDINIFEEKYHKTIIKTPAQVNECVEVFKIPNFNHPDYPKCVVMSNLIGLNTLHKEIREKGGAYGSGASPSDSGLCVMYSYRDPHPERTYNTFEKALMMVSEGKFSQQDIKEAKIFTFSQVDKIINPANKGLELFLRGIKEEDRNIFRNRLLNVNKDDLIEVCKKYFIPQLEEGNTSRVVFGSVEGGNMFDPAEWEFCEALDFLSESYFTKEEEEN
jgi:presequence protease